MPRLPDPSAVALIVRSFHCILMRTTDGVVPVHKLGARIRMKKRRVNLTLPEDLWERLRQRVPPRQISQYVTAATEERLAAEDRIALRAHLKEQYLAYTQRDLQISESFFFAEQEALEQTERNEGGPTA